MPSIGGMPEAEEQIAIRDISVAAIHAVRAKVGAAARPIQPAASRARHAPAFRSFAAVSVVIFSLPSDFGRFRPLGPERVIKSGMARGESDKCDGISMDSLITAAARALAAGDPLAALKCVALRDDAPALALRGIAMAQLGELTRAKELLRSAARAFGPREPVARARCVVAEAEIALV
jgi:hypothetical protein